MLDRKQIKREFKEKKHPGAIYIIKNTINKKVFIGITRNPDGIFYSLNLQLERGSHPFSELVDDYKNFGKEKIKFEIIDRVEAKDMNDDEMRTMLKELKTEWIEKLKNEGFTFYNAR